MGTTIATLAGLMLATMSAQGTQNMTSDNWGRLGSAISFGLGDQGCGEGRHQALRRDWRDEWYWGPCVPNR